MLSPGSLVSEEFNELCKLNQVEITFRSLPNPGDPYTAIRMIEIKSYNDSVICITKKDANRTINFIPARGSLLLALGTDEELPDIEKVFDAAD